MNLGQLEKRQAVLSAELGKVRAEIGTISSKILTAPVEGISKLISERVDLHNKEAGLQEALSDIRARMMQAEKQAGKQVAGAERQRKQSRIELWITKRYKEIVCKYCESNKNIAPAVDRIHNDEPLPFPHFIIGNWTTPVTDYHHWFLPYECNNVASIKCRHNIRVYPDAPKGEEIEQ